MSLRDIKKLFSGSRMEAGSSSLEDRMAASKEDAQARKGVLGARRESKFMRRSATSSARGGTKFGGGKLK